MATNWYKDPMTGTVQYGAPGGASWLEMDENEVMDFRSTKSPYELMAITPGSVYNFGEPKGTTSPVESQPYTNQIESEYSGDSFFPNRQEGYGQYWNNDPTDLFQPNIYSTSQSGSMSTSGNISENESYRGLDEDARRELLSSVMPELTGIISQLSGAPERASQAALSSYKNQTRDLIEDVAPAVFEQFGRRNLTDSSLMKDALSQAMEGIAKGYGEKGYQAEIDEANMVNEVAAILGGLTGLGEYSRGTGSSVGGSESLSQSLSQNPGEAYDRILQMLLNY